MRAVRLLLMHIRKPQHAFAAYEPLQRGRAVTLRSYGTPLSPVRDKLRAAFDGDRAELPIVKSVDMSVLGLAQAHRPFQHGIEHRGEIAGRGIDYAQDLGSCCLLLQGFARLGDKARILYRDDRLLGEVLQQRDCFVGEGLHICAARDDHT